MRFRKICSRGFRFLGAAASLSLLFGCSNSPSSPDAALRSFSADRLLGHIRTLSSDEFEGLCRATDAPSSPNFRMITSRGQSV